MKKKSVQSNPRQTDSKRQSQTPLSSLPGNDNQMYVKEPDTGVIEEEQQVRLNNAVFSTANERKRKGKERGREKERERGESTGDSGGQ